MTGVELIVMALAAGASAGVTDTVSSAIRDAYAGLKDLLSRQLIGRQEAVEALDAQEVEPGVWHARLGADLASSGAATDEEVLAAARRLLTLIDPQAAQAGKYRVDVRDARGVQVGDHNTQTNTFS
jgi:hypothetical protein